MSDHAVELTEVAPRPKAWWHVFDLSAPHLRTLKQSVVLLALAPLSVLLSSRLAHLFQDPLFGIYGALMITVTGLVMYLSFAHYRDSSRIHAGVNVDDLYEGSPPLVSMLVAVKNELDVIDRCVLSMVHSTYPNMEIIVVDDGSDDGTTERLQELAEANPEIVLLRNEASVGKKRALTRGALEAKGEFLFFTDSDCVLAPDAIDEMMRAFAADPEIGAASGHARALNADQTFLTKVQDTWYDGQFSVWKAAESYMGAVTCISGPLAAFRREAIYNYFPAWENDRFLGAEFRFATDRQLTGYVLGSTTVGPKLKKKYADSPFLAVDYPVRKWRIEYVRSAKVWTVVPHTLKRLGKQQIRWKKSFVRNLCFTGTFYWRKGPLPATLFYSHSLFVLVTPIMAFRHLVWLPLHGAWVLAGLYLAGVFLKGSIWGLAYKAHNPGCRRWVYRPFMSLIAAVLFAPLLVYSVLTLRKGAWARG